ncbi:ferritin-like domain-containing protein [Sedimenticola sp.]|uniref:ferritin-like domain-containing protein n=1 Tax=Sedimenticola sp. TaxID=1940285 RepID=UPI00258BA10E|nr:ferritin-like domain-containing protein [Sedimenticola sp.]MCW8902342.1 ferritin-like domain-containing protein [Sedimenticola sp.]
MNTHTETTHGNTPELSRRGFLFNSLGATLSATAVALLAGRPSLLHAGGAPAAAANGDIRILNTALAAEREAVAAYQLGAESALLNRDVLKVAIKFQDHHKAHADLLGSTIRTLGGEPAEPPDRYNFPTSALRQQNDVLSFAAGLERGAVSAYAGAIPLFAERDLSKAAASILADEAMHWAILRQVLGMDPVPDAFYS